MNGTIYGNELPRGTQVKKKLETTAVGHQSNVSSTQNIGNSAFYYIVWRTQGPMIALLT
jgi:hypothetical protein